MCKIARNRTSGRHSSIHMAKKRYNFEGWGVSITNKLINSIIAHTEPADQAEKNEQAVRVP